MRTFLGIVLLILGVPVLLVGGAVAAVVGTDNTVDVVTDTLPTDSEAIVVPASVLAISGPTIILTAEVEGANTFVGAAHPVHVASYLDGLGVTRIESMSRTRELTLTTEEATSGNTSALPPPAELDWWREQSSGAGQQHIEVELTEEPASLVVTAAEPGVPVTATVTAAVKVDYLFPAAVAVGVVGLILVIGGLLALRSGRRRRRARAAAAQSDGSSDDRTDDDFGAGFGAEPDFRPDRDGMRGGPDGAGRPTDAGAAGTHGTAGAPGAPPSAPGDAGTVTPVTPLRPRGQRRVDEYGRPLRTAVLAVIAVVVPAGCGAIPEPVDHTSTALVAATPEQNEEFFAAYTKVGNAASATQDATGLAEFETGSLLEASTFGFEVERAQGIEPADPFTVAPTGLAAPAFDSYPLFYLASTDNGDGAASYYLLSRPAAREPWRAAAVVDLPSGAPFDLLAAVTSTPEVADPDDVEEARSALDVVAEYSETGQAPEGLEVASPGSLADLNRLGYGADADDEGIGSLSRTCEVTQPVEDAWLATGTGVLTVAVATCTQELQTENGFWFTPDADYGTVPGGTDITATTVTGTVPFLAKVDSDGSIAVFGGRLSLTQTDAVTR